TRRRARECRSPPRVSGRIVQAVIDPPSMLAANPVECGCTGGAYGRQVSRRASEQRVSERSGARGVVQLSGRGCWPPTRLHQEPSEQVERLLRRTDSPPRTSMQVVGWWIGAKLGAAATAAEPSPGICRARRRLARSGGACSDLPRDSTAVKPALQLRLGQQ